MLNIPIRQYWNLLATYLTPQRNQVLTLAALVSGSIVLQLLNPQIIRYFIDTAESGGAQPALLLAAGLYLGFSLTQRGVALWADYLAQNVGWRATNGEYQDSHGNLVWVRPSTRPHINMPTPSWRAHRLKGP